jgi:hypothetical protein
MVAIGAGVRPGPAVYTVHDVRSGNVYSLRQSKTAVVVFRSYQDAFTVSRALEHHFRQHADYPPWDLDEVPRAMEALRPAPLDLRNPTNLTTQCWADVGDLATQCQTNALNIMYCKTLSVRPHISFDGYIIDVESASFTRTVAEFESRLWGVNEENGGE